MSKDVAFFITLVNVSSDEVKMPSSAKWLVEAELVDPATEEATELPDVAIFSSRFKPRSVGVCGKLMKPASSSVLPPLETLEATLLPLISTESRLRFFSAVLFSEPEM